MTLDTQHPSTTSAAGPTGYYSGLPRLAQGHSSPRLDHHPYPYLYQNSVPGSFNNTNPSGNPNGNTNGNLSGNGNVDSSNNSTSLIQNASTPLNLPMNPPVSMNNPSTSIPMSNLMNSSMMNSIHSRNNHSESNHSHLNNTNSNPSLSNNTNLPIPFPTSLRSNSWDGQAMVPYQWGLPSHFHERHRASQPDIGQVPSSSMPFQSQFTANYNPNFHQLNFDQQMYPQSNLNDIPNSNVQLPFPSNRFAYPDGRPYSVLGNSTAGFAYGKPYDKPTSPRGLAMFGEPAFTDRPHLCQIPNCGRMFKRLEHLKRHHRSIHTHERPYPCRYPKCSKAFSRSDNLAQHMRIHRQDPHTDL